MNKQTLICNTCDHVAPLLLDWHPAARHLALTVIPGVLVINNMWVNIPHVGVVELIQALINAR